MSKYSITTSFNLSTAIEPEGFRIENYVDSDDIQDNTYFSSVDVDCGGGEVTYVVEADDEDDAYSQADGNITDGNEFEDDNGFTWVFVNVNHDVERVVEPMTLKRATEILSDIASQQDDDEVAEAVSFVLSHLASLASQVASLNAKIADLQRRLSDAVAPAPAVETPSVFGA